MNEETIQLILQTGNNFMLGVLSAAGLCLIVVTIVHLIFHYLNTKEENRT